MIFCQGCPWRCRYCHNQGLLDPNANTLIHWREVRDFLTRRVGLLDAVVFSGGEPTAQNALAAAIPEVRALGFKIGLHTSGAYPERLRRLLPLLDWVGLDIKSLPEGYDEITGVKGSGESRVEEFIVTAGSEHPAGGPHHAHAGLDTRRRSLTSLMPWRMLA